MTTITLAHNPSAGTGRHSHRRLVALLDRSGHRVRYLSTKKADLEAALRRPGRMVAVAGGDGTVTKIARVLNGAGVPVAILPFGTANNIARALKVRGPTARIVAGWRPARIVPFDLVAIRGRPEVATMVESLGIGGLAAAAMALHADGDGTDEPREALHRARRAFAKSLARARPVPGIMIDREKLPDDVLFVEVLNVPSAGPRLHLCRNADFGDGKVDVVYARKKHRKQLVEWLKNGAPRAETPSLATLAPASRLSLSWSGAPLRVDDTFFPASDKRTRLTLTVRPGAIGMIVPNHGQ